MAGLCKTFGSPWPPLAISLWSHPKSRPSVSSPNATASFFFLLPVGADDDVVLAFGHSLICDEDLVRRVFVDVGVEQREDEDGVVVAARQQLVGELVEGFHQRLVHEDLRRLADVVADPAITSLHVHVVGNDGDEGKNGDEDDIEDNEVLRVGIAGDDAFDARVVEGEVEGGGDVAVRRRGE